MKTVKSVNYKENKTMVMIGRQYPVLRDSAEGEALLDVIKAFGLNDDIVCLTPGELIYFCSSVLNLGKILGIRAERERKLNGKQKNKIR